MKTNVTFQTTIPVDMESYPFGEELARELLERMVRAGIPAHGLDNYNDFGWIIETSPKLSCPYVLLGYVGDGPFQWLLQIHPRIGFFARLFGKSDPTQLDHLAETLHRILAQSDDFSDIRWHAGEFGPGYSPNP
jgi:hypothetical protein